MALTSGFFNSVEGDRKYDATQFASLFDGVITDGVVAAVGEFFATTPGGGMTVNVGSGRAWFNRTWTYSDAKIPLTLSPSDLLYDRIDAIVLEVNDDIAVRDNTIKVVKGTPALQPTNPVLTDSGNIHQHPLAYVRVKASAVEITAQDITINVGQESCPFVTCIVETPELEVLFARWDAQFTEWFENLKAQMEGNVVANLQKQIDERLKIADKATSAEVLAFSAVNKWVSPDLLAYLRSGALNKFHYIEIKESCSWTAPSNILNNKICALMVGGGGGGGGAIANSSAGGGGGGSGYMVVKFLDIIPGYQYNIVIGAGGAGGNGVAGSRGGATSFGNPGQTSAGGGFGGAVGANFIGGAGGNGSAGGGGGFGLNRGGAGGNGSTIADSSYGGGGGGGGGSYTSGVAGNGGSGGTYGGGGGGGGSCQGTPSSGGSGGTYGAGGNSGVNGSAGKPLTFSDSMLHLTHNIPEGSGTAGLTNSDSSYRSMAGGGGGGGFGGKGGTAQSYGGGGGGGFFGSGGDSVYRTGGKGESGSGAGGGGAYPDTSKNGVGGNGGSGICILIFYTR